MWVRIIKLSFTPSFEPNWWVNTHFTQQDLFFFKEKHFQHVMWVRIIKLSFTPSFERNWGVPISPNKEFFLKKNTFNMWCGLE
jgi:hypothetical protein